jgi:hypothetical protein
MLAMGSKCEIGDQLHPSGQIDQDVYNLIGSVYAAVEKKEPWCQKASPVVEIGVFTPEEFQGGDISDLPSSLMGVTRMLEESAHQFDILDSFSDLSPYQVLILPDDIPVSNELAIKLDDHLAGGGALIASFASGMDIEQNEFAYKSLGVRLKSEGPRDLDGKLARGQVFIRGDYCEYILPKGQIGQGLPETEHVMYIKGMDIEAGANTAVLANNILSYFDRTYQHFCSHRQTPSSGQVGSPAIVKNGSAIYFSHPIFTQYDQIGSRWCKTLFLNALKILLPEPLVQHEGPSTMQVTVTEQTAENRWVIHLLHYIPERRSQSIDIIEDVIPLYEVKISIKVPQQVKAVTLVPKQEALTYDQQGDRVEWVLPKLDGHQMIALQF